MRVPVLEVFEVMQGLFAVEDPNVLRLGRRQAADSPAQVHKMGLDGRVERMHPDLAGKVVRLPGVAGAAGGDDVGPVVGAPARERNEVIAGEGFARLELDLQPAAVLTAIAIARKEEGVRYLTAKAARDVDEAREPDHGWTRERQFLGADYAVGISFDDLRFSIDHQPQCAAKRNHRQRLKRSIQCQTTNDQALLLGKPTQIYNSYPTTTRPMHYLCDDRVRGSVTLSSFNCN